MNTVNWVWQTRTWKMDKPNFLMRMYISGWVFILIRGRVTSANSGGTVFMCSIMSFTAVSVIFCSTCCRSVSVLERGSRMYRLVSPLRGNRATCWQNRAVTLVFFFFFFFFKIRHSKKKFFCSNIWNYSTYCSLGNINNKYDVGFGENGTIKSVLH